MVSEDDASQAAAAALGRPARPRAHDGTLTGEVGDAPLEARLLTAARGITDTARRVGFDEQDPQWPLFLAQAEAVGAMAEVAGELERLPNRIRANSRDLADQARAYAQQIGAAAVSQIVLGVRPAVIHSARAWLSSIDRLACITAAGIALLLILFAGVAGAWWGRDHTLARCTVSVIQGHRACSMWLDPPE